MHADHVRAQSPENTTIIRPSSPRLQAQLQHTNETPAPAPVGAPVGAQVPIDEQRIQSFEQIDWSIWTPRESATLIFVIKDGQILLIRKKRGLGAGKINGPGGRIDPGETPEQCAIREAQEELHITPREVTFAGELFFQFTDGYSLHGFVYRAGDYDGTPTETGEAAPLWTPLNRIPYPEMWADDEYWLPHMLAGRRFSGRFLFDGDSMLGYDLNFPADE